MTKYLLTFCLFLFIYIWSTGQAIERCYTLPPTSSKLIQAPVSYPSLNKLLLNTEDTIIIPVVIHIIHNNSAGTIGGPGNPNISDAQIMSQLKALNDDYMRMNADTVNTPTTYANIAGKPIIQFCLATTDPNGNATTGINRVYNSKASYQVTDDSFLKGLSYWPSNSYLNIWVCNLRGSSPLTLLLGYSSSPGGSLPGLNPTDWNEATDGIVINYKSFGTTGDLLAQFNLGRTLTHEVGHWLGLFHTWGKTDTGGCGQTDYCDDTPDCDGRYTSSISSGCPIPTDCTEPRMIQNYMDYSTDACTNLFTKDQSDRMRAIFTESPRRAQILNSLGCCTINSISNNIPSKDFEDQNITSGNWELFNANSPSTNTPGFTIVNKGAYNKSDYSLVGSNDSMYNSTTSPENKYYYTYTSPYIKINTINNPTLRFDWAYTLKSSVAPSDSVVISYVSGCGTQWVPLKTFNGSNFYSTTNYRDNFIPQESEWATTEVPLASLTQLPALRIRFEVYSKGGNLFYLDNIQIAATSNELIAKVYPNPFTDNVSIESVYNGKKSISYRVYNVLGQLLFETKESPEYSHTFTVNLALWSSGVYFFQISDGDKTKTIKVIKD
jgi:hypothetical protein